MSEAKKFKRIGVLTSGGDAPGMNAAVRSVVLSALAKGIEVMGIEGGYKGLIHNEMRLLNVIDVANIISLGGTVLYSDRCLDFKTEEGMQKAVATCKLNGIDGIVAIGGDGTFRGATDLSRRGIPCIGIPGTIDNDISATDYSIGFDTAMNTVIEMVDRLRDTCESHARCNVVEVMGRNAGYIALETGIAVGATGIAICEEVFNENEIIERIKFAKTLKKRNFLVIVSEGMPAMLNEPDFSEKLAKKIQAETDVETKFARLAHVQRGGNPTLRDRYIATLMGNAAVEHLLLGESNIVVCLNKEEICVENIEKALTFDRIVKKKASAEEIGKLDDSTREELLKKVAAKQKYFDDIYAISKENSI